MPHSASEILEGYGVYRSNPGIYHTYVLSSLSDSWGCHGGTTGGTQVCAGPGSVSLARCIEGGDEAGIFYLRTGVCHQIANRILSPAGVIIPKANHRPVRASYLAFGEFGRNDPWVPADRRWPDRKHRCQSGGAQAALARSSSGQVKTGVISSMTEPTANVDPDPRAELSSLIEAGLGHSVDDDKLSALAMMQEHLQTRIGELGGMLADHKISPERYLDELNRAFDQASSTGEKILGREDFHRVFGELKADQLGDLSTFFAEFKN